MAEQTPTAVADTPAAPVAPVAPVQEPSARRPSFADFDHAETEKDLARGKPAAPRSIGEKFVDAVIEDRAAVAPAAPAAENDDAPALDAQGQQIKDPKTGRFLSRREKQEQRTREAVDRATEGLRQQYDAAQRELAQLRSGQPAQPQQPNAQPAAQPAQSADEKEPELNDFIDQPDPYLAFGKAHGRWTVRQELKAERAAAAQQAQQDAAQREATEKFTSYQTRENALKATVPDFDAKTLPVREKLDMRSPLSQALIESEVAPQILLHFADHPDEFARIGALGVSNFAGALRALWTLEQTLIKGAAPAAPVQPAASDPPKPKLITDAPPIGTVLGNQPAPAADPTRAAVARKDFAAFDEAETRKDLASRRR